MGGGDADRRPITVVLADDHAVVRQGLRMILESDPDIEVVAEAGDAESAARYVLGHKPSVVLLDISMPGESSLDLIPRIIESSPETAVVILTMQTELAFAQRALKNGARGYVLKQAAAEELVSAIRSVLAGGTYLNPELGARLAAMPEGASPPDQLTPREVEVLNLLAQGYMNPEIAEKLVLSVRTVETHRANLQRKTGLTTRAELNAYAADHGLIER